jgi:hypothetical protein
MNGFLKQAPRLMSRHRYVPVPVPGDPDRRDGT